MEDDPCRLYRLDGVAHIAGVINEEHVVFVGGIACGLLKWFRLWFDRRFSLAVSVTGFACGIGSGLCSVVLHVVAVLYAVYPQRCISSMRRQQGMPLDERYETFGECPVGADEETVRRFARAYIMILLGTQLFVDKSGNRIHIRWLPYVARLEEMAGVCSTSIVVPVHVLSGEQTCGKLLQSWIFWRFSRFRPAGYDTCSWPLASSCNTNVRCRWSGYNPPGGEKGPRVQNWRLRLDISWIEQKNDGIFLQFIWMPYSTPEVLQVVHPEVLEPRHTAMWRSVTSLIYFAVIE
ncbi:hypothetical protein Ahy_A09g044602 [Arachis hypogaea]|uniref:Aminotransferase-like plant mobile domain-containing protein n=1 Tax=Arachis hypogaea TaxID=3818 RepID=A0A445BKF1_ARAHY|nr:hypothetical protein Ahy_A09g044602 [Arachis hypogaea]